MNERKILVSAYGCEPLKGSEAGVGWNWVLQMAKRNMLHVITRANNQESIEAYLPDELKSNITFHYYDAPTFIRNMKKKAKGLYFYYLCWQIGIIPLVRRIIRDEKVDFTMHLTFGSMWMPTFLPFFHTPFIWGPVGGGDCEPSPFLKVLPLKQRVIQSMRYIMNRISFMHPSIIIFDEATSMLDPKGKESIKSLINEIHKDKSFTIISITHDIEEVLHADDCIVMNNGRLYKHDKPENIFADGEKLKKINLDVPFSLKFHEELKKHGVKLKSHKESEMVDELWQLASRK